MLFESSDLASAQWTSVPDAQLPESPRHGTVIPVTASEYQRLLETYQPDALQEGVTVTPAEATLAPGATRQLAASVSPVTAEDRSVTWTSSDDTVAIVDASGLVTAVADGTATITASSTRGTSGQAAITVSSPLVPELPDDAWIDEFDGETLGDGWSIVSEVPSAWSLSENPGSLTLHSQPGDTYQTNNTARNVFMVDIPDGDFTAITQVSAPVSKVYQGAGLIAWSDMDNYVRSGLTYVGPLAPSGVAVETDVETAANFSAVAFEDRPGSTGETLRLQRTGDVITSSVWNEAASAWTTAATTTVGFDVTQIGVYALAALDGTTFDAVFDYFAYQAVEGQDVVPAGSFTLRAAGDAPYLVTDGNQLARRCASGLHPDLDRRS